MKIALSQSPNKMCHDFKASQTWVNGFLRRNNWSIQQRTQLSQKLPEDCEEKVIHFQQYIIRMRRNNNYELSQIGNADQTPLTFDLSSTTTVDYVGRRTVFFTTTGNEKNHFTVMLAGPADGGKLPPYLVFKHKRLPKGAKCPSDAVVGAQEKGWMDQGLVGEWVETLWQRHPGCLTNKSLLVLDAFRVHKSPQVCEVQQDGRTDGGGGVGVSQPELEEIVA